MPTFAVSFILVARSIFGTLDRLEHDPKEDFSYTHQSFCLTLLYDGMTSQLALV